MTAHPTHISAAMRRILAQVDFYAGVRAGHRQHPANVSHEQVSEALGELRMVILAELEAASGGRLLQDETGSGARQLSRWLSGKP